jgi:curved DNA-binding protein CbpA
MTTYFADCLTVESVKARYRELAMLHHPDRGGNTATMQDVNLAYHQTLERLDGEESHDSANRVHRYRYDRDQEQAIMDKVGALLALKMPGVELYLIGLWLWIVGDTRPHKEALKAAGCCWHSKRGCWYWRAQEQRHYGRRNAGSLGDLARKYGCRQFAAANETALAVA